MVKAKSGELNHKTFRRVPRKEYFSSAICFLSAGTAVIRGIGFGFEIDCGAERLDHVN